MLLAGDIRAGCVKALVEDGGRVLAPQASNLSEASERGQRTRAATTNSGEPEHTAISPLYSRDAYTRGALGAQGS